MTNHKWPLKGVTFFLVISALFGCHQELHSPLTVGSNQIKASVAPYPFAWETADFMPVPSGATPVPVPWGNGVSILYNPYIRYDYKSADGWKLLYNNFNTTASPNPAFF